MKYDLRLNTVIDARSAGKTLVLAIAERFSYHPVSFWQAKIDDGQILINGKKAFSEQILEEGDDLCFEIPDFEEPDIDSDYQTIWRNDFLLLVNKPAGLPVHSTRRFYHQTLIASIRRNEGSADINPLQRLDRETSGLMFLCWTSLAPRKLKKNFKDYLTGKFYLAVVRGHFPWEKTVVDQPLKESLTPPVRYKMLVAEDGKPASSIFFRLNSDDECSLLLIKLETGRKHQIRAHLEHLGHSLIGEKLYYKEGYYFLKRCDDDLSDSDLMELGSKNHLLHAYAVKTSFPGHEPQTFFASRTSEEFSNFLQRFPGWQEAAKAIIEEN
jgi:RluA family pseudouridine synthase